MVTTRNRSKGLKVSVKTFNPPRPADLPVIASAIEPILGPWPATGDALQEQCWKFEERLLAQGDVTAETCVRRPGLAHAYQQENLWPRVNNGKVQVLDVPDYIACGLIQALPPDQYKHLGVATIRSVLPDATPELGRAWYVITKVRGSSCLRIWQHHEWPNAEERAAADWDALVVWWNAGVEAGWGTFSTLNDTDQSVLFDTGTPPWVLARLKPTAGLTAWLASLEKASAPNRASQAG